MNHKIGIIKLLIALQILPGIVGGDPGVEYGGIGDVGEIGIDDAVNGFFDELRAGALGAALSDCKYDE